MRPGGEPPGTALTDGASTVETEGLRSLRVILRTNLAMPPTRGNGLSVVGRPRRRQGPGACGVSAAQRSRSKWLALRDGVATMPPMKRIPTASGFDLPAPLRTAQNRLCGHSGRGGCGGPDPSAFVQHTANAGTIVPAGRFGRYFPHGTLPRLGSVREDLLDAGAALRFADHGTQGGGEAAAGEDRPACARLRELPDHQAIEAPAAAVGDDRQGSRGAVRPAGRRGPRGADGGDRGRTGADGHPLDARNARSRLTTCRDRAPASVLLFAATLQKG